MSDPTTQLAQPSEVDPLAVFRRTTVQQALRFGDPKQILRTAWPDLDVTALEPSVRAAVESLASFAVEVRRGNVGVIGDHEVMVRRFPSGDLQQSIRSVKLSLRDGTLYQIPVNKKVRGQWEKVIEHPDRAKLTFEGTTRLNQQAGCSGTFPSTVIVDGVPRPNPYIERAPSLDGGPGEIVRIFVAYVVVGPAPGTGDPVVLRYHLDYDPRVDLRLALSALAKGGRVYNSGGDDDDDSSGWGKACEGVRLMPARRWPKFLEEREASGEYGWSFLSTIGGVGIAFNCEDKAVVKAIDSCQKAGVHMVKKAQTVAMRNAMRVHPALAYQTVKIDPRTGEAHVPVVAWSSTNKGSAWIELMKRLSRGIDIDSSVIEGMGAEVRDVSATVSDDDVLDGSVGDDETSTIVVEVPHEEATETDGGTTTTAQATATAHDAEPTKPAVPASEPERAPATLDLVEQLERAEEATDPADFDPDAELGEVDLDRARQLRDERAARAADEVLPDAHDLFASGRNGQPALSRDEWVQKIDDFLIGADAGRVQNSMRVDWRRVKKSGTDEDVVALARRIDEVIRGG